MMSNSLSFFSLLTFSCIAYIVDIFGIFLNLAQSSIIFSAVGFLATPVGVITGLFVSGLEAVGLIDFTDIVAPLIFIIGLQVFFSLIVFCTYLTLLLIHHDSFSLFDFSLVFAVFVGESLPFLGGLTLWSILAHFFLFRQRASFLSLKPF